MIIYDFFFTLFVMEAGEGARVEPLFLWFGFALFIG
jgi:hypothetical protein